MSLVQIFLRLSHHYQDGYSGLDQFERVATFKMLQSRTVTSESKSYDDRVSFIKTFIAPAPPRSRAQSKMFALALADTLSGSRCRHEHDCCGCWSRSADVIGRHGRRFTVRMIMTRNV